MRIFERPGLTQRFLVESDLDGRDVLLMDTIIATGATVLKLLDEMKATIEASVGSSMECSRCVTVLTCYANPRALNAIMGHPLVKGIAVGAVADGVDNKGFLFPSTEGDIGDKLFGEEA